MSFISLVRLYVMFSPLMLASTVTVTLYQQCWHEYPLSATTLQCATKKGHQYAHANTAPSSPLPPNPHAPWSYPPLCTSFLATINSTLCVYTDTTFSHGRGISLFTTPPLASTIVSLPPFTDRSSLTIPAINTFSGSWTTSDLPGKGVGMLASHALKPNDRVTAYTPALLAFLESELSTSERERFFRTAVQQLPAKTREMYEGLATVYGIEAVRYQDIVKANTFQLEIGGANHLAVFPETSRLNHACAPNAQYYLDSTLLTHFVHTTRPIAPGEEITISYTSPLEPTQTRLERLQQGFHFTCTCPRCTSPHTDSTLSSIQAMQSALTDWTPSSTASPALAERLLDTYREEGLEGFMDVPYGIAALAYNAAGDVETAKEYAARAEELVLLKDGEWSRNLGVWREVGREPRGHWSFGLRRGR